MKISTIKAMFVAVLMVITLAETSAMAAEAKAKYKKTTGQVVSVSENGIVLKGRSKQPVTVAVNGGTEILGAKAAKAGDTVAVNYRVDKNGKTATRIKVIAETADKQNTSAPAVQKLH